MAINFHHEKKVYHIPADSYNELSARQLIAICGLFANGEEKEIAALKALHILLGCKLVRYMRIPLDAKQAMLPYIEWVFERNGLTVQLLPEYEGLYGPASEFDNLTMGEWNACEIYYSQLALDATDEGALNNLIAVLYRLPKPAYNFEKNSCGDVRVPFNPNETDYWATQLAAWPLAVKYAILTWYDGCREHMKDLYDIWDSTNNQNEDVPQDMFEVIRGLCGTTYGGFDAVEKMNVHKALREMEIVKREAEELKRQTPSS